MDHRGRKDTYDYNTAYDNTFYEDEYDQQWIDYDASYFQDSETALDESYDADVFDVDEYDSVYASFVEAGSKLNHVRVNRGFYPAVALMDQSGKRGQGRSKGKSKGKSKSKGKGRGSSPPQKGSAKSRVKAFFGGGRQLCLRCGAAGHQARNCPSQGNKKRKHEDGDDPVHMVETTTMMDYFTDIPEDIPSDVAVQDGGAASFLGSYVQIRKYLRYLVDLGYDITTVQIYRCKKGFKYGNSEKEIATTCLMLPIFAGHRRRHVLCYAVGGSCPILIERPLLEKLGLTVDYSKRKYKWNGQQWQKFSTWTEERLPGGGWQRT